MIPIGVFAGLSGVSAKALRHYHDRGLLVPAHVDPQTGYRTYDIDQLEDAARIAVLRQADMPLDRIARLLESPDRSEDLLQAYREELAAERSRADRALALARDALCADASAVERPGPIEAFVAVAVAAPVLSGGEPDDDLDARVAAAERDARAAAEAAGADVTGPCWTTMDFGERPAVVVHWPVATVPAALPDGMTGGRLPERTELVVRIPVPTSPGDESVQLALAALLRGRPGWPADPRTLRQTQYDDSVEYAVTLVGDR